MPQQDQFRQVNGPQGPINFPAQMSDDQVTQAMQKLYPLKQSVQHYSPPEAPQAQLTTGKAGGPDPFGREEAIHGFENALSDIRYGGKRTWVGKGLSAIPGWHGTGGGLGDVASGPLTGVPEVALGISRMFRPHQMIHGGLEAAGGLFTGTGLAGAAVEPEFLPTMAKFTSFQEAAAHIGQRLGLHPDTNNLISTILATAGTGATLDPRMRINAIEAEKSNIRASRGFGASVDEAAVTRAAQENVAKAEAQANTIKEIAKNSGQTVAQVLQSGAASTGLGGKGEELKQKFGSEAKGPLQNPKPAPTPEEVQSKFLAAQTPPELLPKPEVKTRPVSQVEKIEQMAKATPVDKEAAARQELEQLRAQRGQEVTDLKAMIAERRALNPDVAKAWDSGVREKPAVPEDASKLEKKQAAMKDRQQIVQTKEAKAQTFIDQHREAQATQVQQLRKENADLKASVRPEVGRETAPPEATKLEPVQTQTTARSGEPVRPATQPEVAKGEPRSMRGDLGERTPQPTTGPASKVSPEDFQKRMELFRQRVEALQADPKYKGVGKARLQEIASEQMRKERGSFGGGGPDDVRARREAKINDWINQLRDPKTDPASLDTAFKQLQAYGLDHNEIIRRVAGSEGFATDPHDALAKAERERESLEERLGPNADLDAKADSLIGGLMGSVDKVMGNYPGADRTSDAEYQDARRNAKTTEELIRDTGAIVEGRAVGEPSIGGVKDPQQAELERMFNLKDERGFWRMLPAKKAAPKGPGTGTALDDLTRQMEQTMKAVPPNDSRMKIAERLDKTVTEGWDKVQLSLGKIAAQSVALKDAYMRPPEQTDYHTAIGRFSGALNRSAWELRQFTKEIKDKLPDERQREAVTNWLQANGDDQILAQRAAASKGSTRAGYERARTLTQEEIGYAKMYEAHFDRRLKEAIQLGILDHGIDNYVPQIWKPDAQQAMSNHFSSLTRGGLVKPDFNSAKKRIFDSYFDGEQAGRVPVTKDIGFLVSSWEKAFNQAVASRNLVLDLSKGLASDGRPIVAPTGGMKTIWESGSQSPLPGDPASAYLIYPKTAPEDTGDYRAVDHPAMTKWQWVGKDQDGAPVYMKGDLRVHPEFFKKFDNTVNRGKWAASHPIQTAILKGQGFFKATLLSMSPFHQIQEGTHAIFHNVNPMNPPNIDLANPSLGKLLDRGLVIGNYDPVAAFDEGLTSGSGGAVGKIPGLGRQMQKYSDYLFSDYIPRLKAKMATEAYDRNLKRFDRAIAQGAMTTDQIAEITANQANAAFGELNYITLGRHPQTQAAMRMMFLAPDFLEARARFAGQALTPFGREQRTALLRGALGMYVTARVVNKLLDDDYHWDSKDAFSIVVKGYDYKIRSLPGDIWNLMQDGNSFVQHRLSFIPRAGTELTTGKDDFGRRRNAGEQAIDFAKSVLPIPTQGFLKDSGQGAIGGLLSATGITRSKYRSEAGSLAHQYAIGSNPNDVTSHHISQMVQDIVDGRFDGKQAREMVQEGKMNPQDITKAADLAALPELWRDYRGLPVELKAKIWKEATPKERALLTAYSHRELDMTRLLPEQRAQFMREFAGK